MKKKQIALIALIVLVLVAFVLVSYILTKKQIGVVESVIDGDTIKIKFASGKIEVVRLLSINAPEKSQPYYSEAKDYLSVLSGKEVILERKGKDK